MATLSSPRAVSLTTNSPPPGPAESRGPARAVQQQQPAAAGQLFRRPGPATQPRTKTAQHSLSRCPQWGTRGVQRVYRHRTPSTELEM